MVSRVVVIDEFPLFRDGVIAAIAPVHHLKVVASCAKWDASRPISWDGSLLVFLGVASAELALRSIREIVTKAARATIVCLTSPNVAEHVPQFLRAGARACIPRNTTGQELVRCIEQVQGGGSYVAPSLAATLLVPMVIKAQAKVTVTHEIQGRGSHASQLTGRETEILRLVARGMTNRDIAVQLTLSEKTVKRYMTFIMQKIQVRNRMQAALYLGP